MSSVTVIVDKVTVNDDGTALVKGYNASNYSDVELTVNGALVGGDKGKLVSKTAHELANANSTSDKTYAGKVALGTKSNDTWTDVVTFEEGSYYTFNITTDGVYYVNDNDGKSLASNTEVLVSGDKLKVQGGYVYVNGTAKYYTSDVVILEKVVATGDAAKAAYCDTYNKYTSYPERQNVEATYTYNSDGKVTFIYITTSAAISSTTEIKALADGQTIVQVLSDSSVEAGYDYFVYEAIDLLAGKKVEVKASGVLTGGNYYVVADGAVVEDTTGKWMRNKTIYVDFNNGLIPTIKANVTLATKTDDKAPVYKDGDSKEEFGIDAITIYTAGADDVIDLKDDKVTATTKSVSDVITNNTDDKNISCVAYIVEGRIIMVIE